MQCVGAVPSIYLMRQSNVLVASLCKTNGAGHKNRNVYVVSTLNQRKCQQIKINNQINKRILKL